ncbi:hypothetical protein [Thalassotalea euphylliae]|uniref:Transmembrane anchor protein n=1 Tax=Thalassotalea euphylliae TaxID=1655234 RepID=A0A3E0UKC7_9GAMM|nr:hypothetical protein [Thalassotalea euphylliae]REL37379.1 hypothetical protein DXX92_09910 [Thalassotalea euphylliae]
METSQVNQTNRSLVKATISSLVVAVIALVLFILPAEYSIDPTGVGQKLGLTVFNEAGSTPTSASSDGEQDAVLLTVPAGKGIEYKLSMNKFQKATYEWVTDGGALYVDLHGEPKGDTTGYFESYTIASVEEMKGSFTVPFDGSHGWYWKNNSDKDINIQLLFSGNYVIEGLK